MQQRRPSAVLRVVLATLLASAGAVLLVAGLLSALGPDDALGPDGPEAILGTPPPAATPIPAAPTSTPAPGASAATPGIVTLVGAGDIADCASDADEETARLVEGLSGIVFTLGDNAYENGSEDEFATCFDPTWGRFKDRIELPVPGNHEYGTEDAAGYRAYFGERAVRDGRTWYSTDVGAWHVVVLDSTCDEVEGGCGPDSPQVRWLREDLAASDARCTLALFHHPRFSSGEHGSDAAVAPFWDALYEAGADLILNGHEHSYERFAPLAPTGDRDDERGIVQLIAGTGGRELRGFGDPVEHSRLRAAVSHGVLRLDLQPGSWTFQFLSTDGVFSDTGARACH
ncbi:MAG TPA: metallophosphoesterase [Candidatus Limnocylindrales bacterium]|nr:metallophosphoesterase [Candidatus Limnocylindrales bacterium]